MARLEAAPSSYQMNPTEGDCRGFRDGSRSIRRGASLGQQLRSQTAAEPEEEPLGAPPRAQVRVLQGRRAAAAQEADQPKNSQHNDGEPDQVDKPARRVEQQPDYEEDCCKYQQGMNHLWGHLHW